MLPRHRGAVASSAALRFAALVALLLSIFAPPAARAQETGSAAERLRIPFPRDDGTLTPYTFDVAYPLMTLVYDTLLWRGRNGSPEPWLARRIRKTEGGRRLTIRLRSGARWHDGKPLTADDVKFSFDYFKSRYHRRFSPQLAPVSSTEVVDRATVALELSHPAPGFGDQPLADMPILPRHLWANLTADRVPPGPPIGSGPYRLVRHDRSRGYRFRANPRYFLGRPRVDTIEVPFIPDFERTVAGLQRRQVDMIPATLPRRTEDRIRQPAFKVETGELYAGTALMFNLRRRPFDEARVRRAVSMSLGLQRITRSAVGAEGRQADRGYLHPRSQWAAPGVLHRFDEDRARRELARLGLEQIRVLAPDNDPVRREAARQVVLALRRAGQSATVVELTARRLAAAVGQDGSTPSFEAAVWSIPALASYSPDYLRVVFGSGARLAPLNYSGYRSERFDRLAARAARETSPSKRKRLVRSELRLLALSDVPVVPLFFPKGAFVFRPQIYDGWIYVKGAGILDKRSFLPRTITATTRSPGAAPFEPSDRRGGIGAFGIVALLIVGAAVVVVALGVLRRVRGG